jgi:hypothetical protein
MTPSELLTPTTTFPKFTLLGITVSCANGATPEPVRLTAVGELLASLVTVRVPEEPPEEDGAKLTCKVTLWPAAMEVRGIPLVMENAEPETLVWETVTAAVPLFFKVTLWVAVAPTETLPKLRLAGLAERVFEPEVDCVFAVVYPPQPDKPKPARKRASDRIDRIKQREYKSV